MIRFVAAGLLFVAACRAPQAPSILKTDQFEDIPIPRGAVYRSAKGRSASYRTDTFRCGKFVYTYDGGVQQAVAYFKQTMVRPPYSWELQKESGTATNSTTLVFTKGDERCTVDVDQRGPRRAGKPSVDLLVRVNYQYR